MDYSEKLKKLLEWNKIEYVLKKQEGNLKILELLYDGLSIDESLPYEIEDLNDEELYDYIVNKCFFMNIPVLTPDDYLELKGNIAFNKYVGIISSILYAFIIACQIEIQETFLPFIFFPLTVLTTGLTYYNFKELYIKSKQLKAWDNGETIKKNIESYRKKIRIEQIRSRIYKK